MPETDGAGAVCGGDLRGVAGECDGGNGGGVQREDFCVEGVGERTDYGDAAGGVEDFVGGACGVD